MPLVSVQTVTFAPLCVTRAELLGQLRLDANSEAAANLATGLDANLAAAQKNIEHRLMRSCGAATVVSYHRDTSVGRAEFLPDSSTASVVVEYWKNGAWAAATCTLQKGQPPMLYPSATVTPDTVADKSPNVKVTATTAWAVPPDVKRAILLMAEQLQQMDSENPTTDFTKTIDMLLAPYAQHTAIAP